MDDLKASLSSPPKLLRLYESARAKSVLRVRLLDPKHCPFCNTYLQIEPPTMATVVKVLQTTINITEDLYADEVDLVVS